jgi:hypothetical protein
MTSRKALPTPLWSVSEWQLRAACRGAESAVFLQGARAPAGAGAVSH